MDSSHETFVLFHLFETFVLNVLILIYFCRGISTNYLLTLFTLISFLSIFQIISEKSDTEWKFSRTKLWISFFETGSTVPPPFNIMPTPKDVCRLFGCNKKTEPDKHKEREVAEKRYRDVMKCIIR